MYRHYTFLLNPPFMKMIENIRAVGVSGLKISNTNRTLITSVAPLIL
jgi:hypothetical protein